MVDSTNQLEGGCACGSVRYRLTAAPMFVHCCHCRDCQRQTVPAFSAYYDAQELWPAASLERRRAILG